MDGGGFLVRRNNNILVWSDSSTSGFTRYGYYIGYWRHDRLRNCVSHRLIRTYRYNERGQWRLENCSIKIRFVCWKHGVKSTKFPVVYKSKNKKETGKRYLPNCPIMSKKKLQMSEAKNECLKKKNCRGFLIHPNYTRERYKNHAASVTLFKQGPSCKDDKKYDVAWKPLVAIMKDK